MDDFQRAAMAARRNHADAAWAVLPPGAQARAIYAELRRIDAERIAESLAQRARRPARHGAAAAQAEPTGTTHAVRKALPGQPCQGRDAAAP